MFDAEASIREWKDHLRARGGVSEGDLDELEAHLRDVVVDLGAKGLDTEESFLIAVKRLGTADALAGEFGKISTAQLWKQLLLQPEDGTARESRRREVTWVVLLAMAAALLAKVPMVLGYPFVDNHMSLYLRQLCFMVLPSVVAYYALKRSLAAAYPLVPGLAMAVAFVLTLAYPWPARGQTELLTALHLPIVLWILVCLPYAGTRWNTVEGRMDFLRASGEIFIYAVLLGLGGGVLVAFTQFIFGSLGLDVERITVEYILVMGGAAVPVVAVYLVESKRSIVESLAPVLARIFTPLFLAVLLVFVLVMPLTRRTPFGDRDFLIAFDVMLALVLGLVLYTVSAHRETDRPGLHDVLGLALIGVALAADAVALVTMLGRLSSFGVTPNRLAALGENLVLLVNLAGLAAAGFRHLVGKAPYSALMAWQTAYLPVYAVWGAFVALAFPPIFGFR